METSLSDVVGLIEGQGRDWLQHKNATNDELAGLRKDLDKFVLASQRPGNTWNSSTTDTGMPPSKTLTDAVRALLAGDQNRANSLFGEAKAMSASSATLRPSRPSTPLTSSGEKAWTCMPGIASRTARQTSR